MEILGCAVAGQENAAIAAFRLDNKRRIAEKSLKSLNFVSTIDNSTLFQTGMVCLTPVKNHEQQETMTRRSEK